MTENELSWHAFHTKTSVTVLPCPGYLILLPPFLNPLLLNFSIALCQKPWGVHSLVLTVPFRCDALRFYVPAVGRPSVYIERKVILQMNCSVLCISQVAYLYRHRTRLYHGSLWVFQHPQMDEWKLCLGLVRQKLEMPALECEIAGDWGRWNL